MPKQRHPIACSQPKFVKVKSADGKTQKVLGFPAFIFDVVELVKADKVKTD